MEPNFIGAAEAAEAIRNGAISSRDLVGACLRRIEECEDSVGAWAHLDPDHAMEQAKRADAFRMRGLPVGPLHGVPVGLVRQGLLFDLELRDPALDLVDLLGQRVDLDA